MIKSVFSCLLVYSIAIMVLLQFAYIQGNIPHNLPDFWGWAVSWAVFLVATIIISTIYYRIMRYAKPVVFIAAIVALAAAHYSFCRFTADYYLNVGISLSKIHRYADSLIFYDKAIMLNPSNPMPYYFKVMAHYDRFEAGDYDKGIATAKQLEKICPNYVQIHYQEAQLHIKRYHQWRGSEYLDLALASLEEEKNINPTFSLAYYQKALVYLIKKQPAKAKAEYKEYLSGKACGHPHKSDFATNAIKLIDKQYGNMP